MANPVADSYSGTPGSVIAGGRFYAPVWAPAAGELKTISYPWKAHPLGRGAVLEEISPKYEAWNPEYPGDGPFTPGFSASSLMAYGGTTFNPVTRQIVSYGAGHSAMSLGAPFAFDLNDLRWKWLATPLPHDGHVAFAVASAGGLATTKENFATIYPVDRYDYDWGEVQGDWSGWPVGFGQPGVVQAVPGHARANLGYIPPALAGNARGKLLLVGQPSGVLTGIGGTVSHLFDYDTGLQRRLLNRRTYSSIYAHYKGHVVDEVSGSVLYFGEPLPGGTRWTILDIATEVWRDRFSTIQTPTSGDHGGNTLHLASRIIIVPSRVIGDAATGAGTTFKFWATHVDDVIGLGSITPKLLNVNVVTGWPLNLLGDNRFIGWSYCPSDECLYCISGAQSPKYWKLSPPSGASTTGQYLDGTWTLTEHTFVGGNSLIVEALNYSFVYNRLTWDYKSRSFIFVPDRYIGPVQAFRPEGL